jgi:putative membrane protein
VKLKTAKTSGLVTFAIWVSRCKGAFFGALIRFLPKTNILPGLVLSAASVMNIFDLPPVNATLNGLSTCLIAAGWSAIRSDRKRAHIACMITALVCSTAFLSCYLTYHFGLLSAVGEGSVKFTADGWIRPVYYIVLVTHLILAFTILPLVIITVIPALRARFDRHRKLGRFTMPIWLYVSITGVIVYFMLYQWYPSTHFEELKKRYELKTRIS